MALTLHLIHCDDVIVKVCLLQHCAWTGGVDFLFLMMLCPEVPAPQPCPLPLSPPSHLWQGRCRRLLSYSLNAHGKKVPHTVAWKFLFVCACVCPYVCACVSVCLPVSEIVCFLSMCPQCQGSGRWPCELPVIPVTSSWLVQYLYIAWVCRCVSQYKPVIPGGFTKASVPCLRGLWWCA